MSELSIKIDVPVKTIKRYSEETGMSVGLIKKMISDGKLQIMPKESPKSAVLINMVAVFQQAAAAAYQPATSR